MTPACSLFGITIRVRPCRISNLCLGPGAIGNAILPYVDMTLDVGASMHEILLLWQTLSRFSWYAQARGLW